MGGKLKEYINKKGFRPELIASHGHTIYHQPENQFTFQLGEGTAIRELPGIKTVYDFRTRDIMLGGQGAPLVPIGDQILYPEYEYCLNLGGIANISYTAANKRIAFDVCFCNMVLNYYALSQGVNYDRNGTLAKMGKLNVTLLEELNRVEYYHMRPPKAIGKEWLTRYVWPTIERYKLTINDILRTCVEHIAIQINRSIVDSPFRKKVLVTGGGAFNDFLMDRIKAKGNSFTQYIKPSDTIVKFKEAMIFAFLGVLRVNNETNVLKTVTGAERDSSSGIIVD